MSRIIWKQKENEVKNAYIYRTKSHSECVGAVLDVTKVNADDSCYYIYQDKRLALTISKEYVEVK